MVILLLFAVNWGFSFVKIKSLRNGEITLSFIDVGKSCLSREFLTSQICILTLFSKIKISRKFPKLQYSLFDAPIVRFVLSPCVVMYFLLSFLVLLPSC